MNVLANTEATRGAIEAALKTLIASIGKVQIGNHEQFPYGWRKAAKGRTVWRLLEELITQNLEKNFELYGFESVTPASSEVGIYDFKCRVQGATADAFINVKSAVRGGRSNKDDISKAVGLRAFYAADPKAELFVATLFIDFDDEMTIELVGVGVVPVAWLPDVYVNPSNNGNLQSAKYKDLTSAVRRVNEEFIEVLDDAIALAYSKRAKKQSREAQDASD